MLQSGLLSHFLVTFAWLVILTVLRGDYGQETILLWLGGLVGTFILDIDHVFYTFIIHPQEPTGIKARQLTKEQRYLEVFFLLVETHEQRYKLNFHNAVFQVFFFLLVLFVLSSTSGLFGKAVVMAASLHLLKDEWSCLLERREEYLRQRLFWPIKQIISFRAQKVFVWIMSALFIGLSFFLI